VVESADAEIASLRVDSWDEETVIADDSSLEFTLPPRELDRIFIEEFRPRPSTAEERALPHAGDLSDAARRDILAATTATPSEEPMPAPLPPPMTALEPAPAEERAATPGRVSQEDLEYLAYRGPKPRWRGAWIAAAVVLALCLVGQAVEQHRVALAATPVVGPAVQALYARFGEDLSPAPSPSVYQLRQWGVTGDPAASGVLHVRASLLNATSQFEPYPLLRVTLADRFGGRIGRRDFEPAEYLGKPTLHLLSPGERADATIDILDPGKNAEGFEIDVCVRGPVHVLHCQGDAGR
jgi:hypothetical protein